MLYTTVTAVDFPGDGICKISKDCLVVIAVTNDQIYTQHLQQQEKKKIKIPPNEKKNVTHLL